MNQTVIQYVLGRLKDLGVTDTFGVPGDFVYPVCDAICDDPDHSPEQRILDEQFL